MATNNYKELLNRLYGKRTWDECAVSFLDTVYGYDTDMAKVQAVIQKSYERSARMNYDICRTIKNVIFNPPATIVFWTDNTKTVVKCENEDYDPEKGLAMCICKKMFGNKGNYYNVFRKWLPKEETELDESLKTKLEDICKPASFTFNLEPIGDKVGLFKALTGSGEEFRISFMEAER